MNYLCRLQISLPLFGCLVTTWIRYKVVPNLQHVTGLNVSVQMMLIAQVNGS